MKPKYLMGPQSSRLVECKTHGFYCEAEGCYWCKKSYEDPEDEPTWPGQMAQIHWPGQEYDYD